MALRDRFLTAIKALAGVSEYATDPPQGTMTIDDPATERAREAWGGQLQPLLSSKLRWYLADLESAQRHADAGSMQMVAQLARAMRRDGVIAGLLKTRTAGLVALPKRFKGSDKLVSQLQETSAVRPLFDEMFPPEALAPFLADYIVTGVAVAELMPVVGRDHPIMVRRDPEFLRYRWSEDRWYFQSVVGPLPITPGDGRWMLLTADRISPWNMGCWAALGRAYIAKEHAMLARANFSAKLANPARVAFSPPGATEVDQATMLEKVIAWGLNTVFQLPQGWDVKLLETNGRGWEVFGEEIETGNLEIMITLAGSKVLVDGGTGFANAGIHAGIRADLIKEGADALAHVVNTQGLPHWTLSQGVDLSETPRVEWDIAPAADRKTEAEGLKAIADAVVSLRAAMAGELALNTETLLGRYGVPIDPSKAPEPKLLPEAPAKGDKPDEPSQSND